MRQDTFSSLDELVEKIDSVTLPNNFRVIQKQNHVAFLYICNDEKPIINYCLKLNSELQYQMWWNGKLVENECVEDAPSLLDSCSMIVKLLDYLG